MDQGCHMSQLKPLERKETLPLKCLERSTLFFLHWVWIWETLGLRPLQLLALHAAPTHPWVTRSQPAWASAFHHRTQPFLRKGSYESLFSVFLWSGEICKYWAEVSLCFWRGMRPLPIFNANTGLPHFCGCCYCCGSFQLDPGIGEKQQRALPVSLTSQKCLRDDTNQVRTLTSYLANF